MFHTFGLASGLRRVRETDMLEAKRHMAHAHHHHALPALSDIAAVWVGDVWGVDALREYIRGKPGRCVLLLDGLLVDATSYLGEHVRVVLSGQHAWLMISHSLEARRYYDVMRSRLRERAWTPRGRLTVA